MKMKYTWVRKVGDGYSCEKLYAGKIKIGHYWHVPYKNVEGSYGFTFLIPGIKEFYDDDIVKLKEHALIQADGWFAQCEKGE
jgi:hypothetical protein